MRVGYVGLDGFENLEDPTLEELYGKSESSFSQEFTLGSPYFQNDPLSFGGDPLSFEEASKNPEDDGWLFKVLPKDMYFPFSEEDFKTAVETKDNSHLLNFSKKPEEISALEKFARKVPKFTDTPLTDSEISTVFTFYMGVFNATKELISREKNRPYLKEQERNHRILSYMKAYSVIKDPGEMIPLKGMLVRAFNGFYRLRNSLHPIGSFAPQCNRCLIYPVWRPLITCFIVVDLKGDGNLSPCMGELCSKCFWLYKESQIRTTGALRATPEFVEYVYSKDNIRYLKECERQLKTPNAAEYDIYVRAIGQKAYYCLFGKARYPYAPPRSIRDPEQIPEFEPGEIIDLIDIKNNQEKAARERHSQGRKRKNSMDLERDIYISLTSTDLRKKAHIRQKKMGSEFIIDFKTGNKRRRSSRLAEIP